MAASILLLQTDFSLSSGLVASMYGVIKCVGPELEIYDLSHNIPKYDTLAASASLAATLPFWPEGTVFVSVVDPGVGTPRRACAARTRNGYYIFTPDNGTLTYIIKKFGIAEVREIDETVNRRAGSEKYQTFHGRDVFAYCAARFAAGMITFEQIGKEYPAGELTAHDIGEAVVARGRADGEIASVLPNFGNLNTNIETDAFETAGMAHGDYCRVTISRGGVKMFDENALYHRSFGFAKPGEPILFNGSAGTIGLALNQASLLEKYFAGEYRAGRCTDWKIAIEKI